MTPVDVPQEAHVLHRKVAILRQELREAEERINRLEDAGDAMAHLLDGIGEADTWRKAKEAKP
jgi:hypothetical protein